MVVELGGALQNISLVSFSQDIKLFTILTDDCMMAALPPVSQAGAVLSVILPDWRESTLIDRGEL